MSEKWCWCNLRRTTHYGPFESFGAAVVGAQAKLRADYEAAAVRSDILAEEEKARANEAAKDEKAHDCTVRVAGAPAGARVMIDGFPVPPAGTNVRGNAAVEHVLRVFARGFEPALRMFRCEGDLVDVKVELVRPRILVAKCLPAFAQHYAAAIQAKQLLDELEMKLVADRAVVGEGQAFELVAGAQAALETAVGAWASSWIKSDAYVVLEESRQETEVEWS